jgi:hypothetical protein
MPEVLIGFDIDCCSFGYDGNAVFCVPRARRAVNKRCKMQKVRVLTFLLQIISSTAADAVLHTNRGFTSMPNEASRWLCLDLSGRIMSLRNWRENMCKAVKGLRSYWFMRKIGKKWTWKNQLKRCLKK